MVIPESQKGSHPANMVSTLKYGLLKDILRMGYHVLVADMDLIFLDNPFNHLYRDSDIESQTDGFEAGWCVPGLAQDGVGLLSSRSLFASRAHRLVRLGAVELVLFG